MEVSGGEDREGKEGEGRTEILKEAKWIGQLRKESEEERDGNG